MGLKDLVAQKAALTEEAIETIVADYVRFDTDEMEIVFTPEFSELSNKAKILVYLVALQGWPFVTKDALETTAKPSEIADLLVIPGGTLRPILTGLRDRHFITSKGGAYSVRAGQFAGVKSEIEGAVRSSPAVRKGKRKSSKKRPRKKTTEGSSRSIRKNAGLGERFDKIVAEGFFDEGKTARDLQERLHEETVMVSTSALPPYFIKAVDKDKTLKRKKQEVDGRKVWVYTAKK